MEPIKLMPMTASFEIVIVGHNNLRTSQAECKLPGIQGRTWRGMIHRYHRIAHFVWLQSAALCRTPAEHEAFMTDIGCYALLLSHQSAWPHRFFSHHRTTSKWLLSVYRRKSGASKYSQVFFTLHFHTLLTDKNAFLMFLNWKIYDWTTVIHTEIQTNRRQTQMDR